MNAVLGRISSTAQELAHYHSGDGTFLLHALLTFFTLVIFAGKLAKFTTLFVEFHILQSPPSFILIVFILEANYLYLSLTYMGWCLNWRLGFKYFKT